ncbi:hypothetical protein SK854_23205 [Lentzea sp. BCCO 10_0061]|uniref:EcsC protein family protein n=1 Tax=Lentzea sokolovensis TaxID=3095429 RepID=A0ABU4V0Z3_9PSEU|nr:hypothetical protein [Lentzea sp. BCCO 10_0061]MDX8145037.1 hypothetical protein [Lentzea sp. BCCO 10_0061]
MASDALEGPIPASSGRGQSILDLLDKAIGLQTPLVRKNIARARQRNPEATPAEVIRTLEKMYVSALASTGAAVGATAAAPAVGTGVALALSAGEFFTSLELSTLFALSVAEVHGVQIDEIERRRTLVMGILLGESGSATIGKVAERTGQHWARQLVTKVPMTTLKQINRVLGKNFITKYGTKQGIIVLGRVVPFGIGAVIGGGANATVAALAVRAARRAFGPAPQSWPETGPEPTPESPHETPPEVVPGIVLEPELESNPGSRPQTG